MKSIKLIYVLVLVVSAEKVRDLPGLHFDIYSDQHSGYLNVSKSHRLFYWFIESQNTPSADPLVFWFNGGPMCSSLFGLFTTHGPFRFPKWWFEDLKKREYTWSRIANVVYLENPSGVGYSYSTNGNSTTDDDLTADENYVAIKEFLKKFPQYRNHDVFLAGESYAGVYIPMLAERIIDGQSDYPIKLKGVAVGNGAFSRIIRQRTSWLYGYSHGLVDKKSYHSKIKECCNGSLKTCQVKRYNWKCEFFASFATREAFPGRFDTYDLSRKCVSPPKHRSRRQIGYPSCDIDFKYYGYYYLNSATVRKALHVHDTITLWKLCAEGKHRSYTKTRTEMESYVKKIVKNGVRVLLFNGDRDQVCDFLTGQRFAASLGLEKLAPKTPWFFRNVVAGYKTMYKGLTHTTIRGAGHSTPITRPKEMLFIESQNTPSIDPLVFWFNGGPMCSSLFALCTAHGPFRFKDKNGTFERNEYTWSRIANVVYLESPAGTGYSYSTDGDIRTNDSLTANENYVAVKEFLKEFPQFRNHDIFLTGESYAGVYVPMLADKIIDGQKDYPINLKGVAVGNGAFSVLMKQRVSWLYGYSHSLIGESKYRSRINECCNGVLKTCDIENFTRECSFLAYFANYKAVEEFDNYDLSRKCSSPDVARSQKKHPSCDDDDFEHNGPTYLNSARVREALHVPQEVPTWSFCRGLRVYAKTNTEMESYVKKIINNGVRVLVYNGDQDKVCDFLTGQRFSATLGLEEIAPKTPWFFKNVVGGYKTMYEGLTFTTIRGAGHSTSSTRPKEMLYVIQQFFNDHSL